MKPAVIIVSLGTGSYELLNLKTINTIRNAKKLNGKIVPRVITAVSRLLQKTNN